MCSPVPFRVIYFGLPLGALLLERDGHELALVAVSRRDVGLRRAEKVFGPRLAYRPDVASGAFRERVRGLGADLLVSWFWTSRLPMDLVRAARLGGIGAHPSLLPRHRGPDPTTWAILAGDDVTGVSVHRLEADYDTGAVLAQERLSISPCWNAWQLAKALDRPSLRVLRATVSAMARGQDLPELHQDEELATNAPFLDDDASALAWSRTTAELLRAIRAFAPSPGAWTEIGGRAVTILRAERAERFPLALEPGEGVVLDGAAVVRTRDGALRLLAGEVDGDPASAEELAALFRDEAHR
jgi:methionyl-tRNA formyltransferase